MAKSESIGKTGRKGRERKGTQGDGMTYINTRPVPRPPHWAGILQNITVSSKIKRTSCFFQGSAGNAMRVDHSRPYIAMSQHHLDSSYIVIGLQEMGRKTVAEGMRSDALR